MKVWSNRYVPRGMLIIVVAIMAILFTTAVVYASTLATHTISGHGDLTINAPSGGGGTTYSFTTDHDTSGVDFTGSVNANQVYNKTVSIIITNTGTGALTVTGALDPGSTLPSGWTLTSSTAGPIQPGETAGLSLTVSSVAVIPTQGAYPTTLGMGTFNILLTGS